MVYRAIGLMSGSSLDGLDIAFASFSGQGGQWSYELLETACYPYSEEWTRRLREAPSLPALDYQLLHAEYGHYLGKAVNRFLDEKGLQFQAQLIASHGHTSFHLPEKGMTAQLGDGAAIAAETGLPVVTDLRALDVAFGGQGAPIVPIGEKWLFSNYDYFLNIGGIANISKAGDPPGGGWGFDVCPANRVLNLLARDAGQDYDAGGALAAAGRIDETLLAQLNALEYYSQPYPKSLANTFGTDLVYPMIRKAGLSVPDALCTYCEHIAGQISRAIDPADSEKTLLVTGGGALNDFLVDRISEKLAAQAVRLVLPGEQLISFKEALIMAFIGVLRWRQENTVLPAVTGASRASIGGALWTGQEA